MTNTPISVTDHRQRSITVLVDDFSLAFANQNNTTTLLGIDSGRTVTWASPITAIPAADFLILTSAKAQGRFKANQAIAINKVLFKEAAPSAMGCIVLFNRVFGALEVTESIANVNTQMQDVGGGTGTFTPLTGDVTSTATGGASTISNNAVTNTKSADMPASTMKGNNTGVAGDPKDLTVAEVKTLLSITNVTDAALDAKLGASTVSSVSITGTSTAWNSTELVTGTITRTLPSAATGTFGQRITYKNVGTGTVTIQRNGTELLNGGTTPITIAAGEAVEIESSSLGNTNSVSNLNTATAAAVGLSEYGIAIAGGSGSVTARMYATAGVSVTRIAADSYRFNIPAGGFLQSWELFLPAADNATALFAISFAYASPTFNTNFETMKPCIIQMMTNTGNIYVGRAAPAATDFASTPSIAASGTLQHLLTMPSALQGGILKMIGKF